MKIAGRQSRHATGAGFARLLCSAAFFALGGCGRTNEAVQAIGNPDHGAIIITRMACGSCHRIPGIEEANGTVGPSLAHFGSRQMIVGVLANSPQNLFRYLKSPQSAVKGNYMPDQRLSDQQVRDAAAYLYTLR